MVVIPFTVFAPSSFIILVLGLHAARQHPLDLTGRNSLLVGARQMKDRPVLIQWRRSRRSGRKRARCGCKSRRCGNVTTLRCVEGKNELPGVKVGIANFRDAYQGKRPQSLRI